MVESFLQRKVYQIIAIMNSRGSNTTASYMPILIWIPTIFDNSPFCVQAKIIKLVGLKNGGRLSPINLVTFAGTQNGE